MTDPERTEYLAARGMGWAVYDGSAHRPGTRPLPHCWRWRRDGGEVWLMVYDGQANRRWDPLNADADRRELADRLGLSDLTADDARQLTLPEPTQ